MYAFFAYLPVAKVGMYVCMYVCKAGFEITYKESYLFVFLA